MSDRVPVKLAEADGFRDFITHGWGDADRTPHVLDGQAAAAAEHRAKLSHALPGKRIVVGAGNAPVRANDTDYDFRPDSDFVWLTGCSAQGAVLVLLPSGDRHDAVLYLRAPAGPSESDFFGSARDGELWIGAVPGLAEWSTALGIECRPLEGLASVLRDQNPPVLAAPSGDPLVAALAGPESADLRQELAELRRIKDDWEIGQLQFAVDATTRAFTDVVRALPEAVAGGGERWLQGTFDRRARTEGNGVGYASIIAAGVHAPVLHWVRNDGGVAESDAILLDAGVEANSFYTADVTRTFPVSGTFSPAQRQVYDLVHAAHLAAIEEVRPGADWLAFTDAAMRVLAEGLHDWGLLPVSVDEALERKGQQHRRYIVCGVGHYLGLDVHDCAKSSAPAYKEGTLEAGMALTVEPGLYFHPNDLTVPEELRGIGVRIEDDFVVTADGARNLSEALPATAADVEKWVHSLR
ncbi:aminopeptidase P family protein [Labedaea rhizosphaerae]|uniref:Xaa-Pro aminopeptidase n=1 Tax=Labedaea rhizosphaerae TaxID=598644 RepID=A0A4R6SMN9_LABRH|nr:aminopeptidase P family protein [Labedaea rhizosphaerae]TDQ05568.1 Xaa-Pro aminopeptidase [Labedaea rhizosphaerae]